MNIKSLLLGSAAALVAVSGVQAADAVVVAEPEPAEYVRICDVYGAGYFYIPGTETCLNVGGYVRVDIGVGEHRGHQDVLDKGTFEKLHDTYSWLTRGNIHFDARTESEMGTLRSYIELSFNNQSARVSADEDDDDAPFYSTTANGWALEHALIQLGGLTIGYTDSLFETLTGSASSYTIDDSIVAYTPGKSHMIAYTFDANNGFSATIGAELGAGLNYVDSYVPHVVAGASFTQGWGQIRGVIGYDSNFSEWAGKLRADINVNQQLSLWVMGGLSSGNDTYEELANHYNTWSGDWAVWGGVDYKFNDKGTLYTQLSYTNGNDFGLIGGAPSDIDELVSLTPSEYSKNIFGAAVGVNYELVPGFIVRPEVSYASGKSIIDGDRDGSWGATFRFQRTF